MIQIQGGGEWHAMTTERGGKVDWALFEPSDAKEMKASWNPVYGDRGQELVVIGVKMDKAAVTAQLDSCLLTEAEMAAGREAWAKMEDPFPEWVPPQMDGASNLWGEPWCVCVCVCVFICVWFASVTVTVGWCGTTRIRAVDEQ